MLLEILAQVGSNQLLHTQLNLTLFQIYGENLSSDDLLYLKHVLWMVNAFFGADLADVNQALDALRQLHKGSELRYSCDWAFDNRTCGKLLRHHSPWVAESLLEPQRETALGWVDQKDDGLNRVIEFQQISRLPHLVDPRHLRDVNQALDSGLDFDERTKIRKTFHGAAYALPQLIPVGSRGPWFWLQLLEAKGDPPAVGIDLQNLDLESLTDSKNFLRIIDATPGNIAYMQQTIDATKIDKGAVACKASNQTTHDIAFFHLCISFLLKLAGLFFKDDAAVHDDVLFGDVELYDAAGDLLANKLLQISSIAGATTRCRHKGSYANVDCKTTLDDASHGSCDGCFLRIGFFQRWPVRRLSNLQARESIVSLFIAPLDRYRKPVADRNPLGVVLKLSPRKYALDFKTYIQEH